MMTAFLSLMVSSLASPFVTFNQVDIPGSALYCYAEYVAYDLQDTLIVEASSCIPDRIFSDNFDKNAISPPQNRNEP